MPTCLRLSPRPIISRKPVRIRVHHQTHYRYAERPSYVVQRLHLTPTDFDSQRTINWKITTAGIENALSYVDGFRNRIHLVTAHDLELENTITAEGEVETWDAAGLVRGLASTIPETVFLRQTVLTNPDAAIGAALIKWSQMPTILETAHSLMAHLHEQISYEVGTSQSDTTAAQAFERRSGVCQDHSHLMVGMARACGIPARYVTGYLVNGAGASSVASHAWAELLIPDLGWIGFDAANGQCPTDQYVRVAAGLDAMAVAPVKGSRRGGAATEQMTVEVRVEIAQQ
jgi:transglutaminase-like putative cysteine protease